MSTTAFRDSLCPAIFPRRSFRDSSQTRNSLKRSPSLNFPEKMNPSVDPTSSKDETKDNSKQVLRSPHPPPVRPRSVSKMSHNENSPKRTYTFSSTPRISNADKKSNVRTNSAPTEVSPRSTTNQQKSSSANQTNKIRTQETTNAVARVPRPPSSKPERNSIDPSRTPENRPKPPKSVQKVRIVLLFQRSQAAKDENDSSKTESMSKITAEMPLKVEPPPVIEPQANMEADFADSMQLRAILDKIQNRSDRGWSPTENVSKKDETGSDLKIYEYDASNLLETATFRLSPRTLKPNEELEAKSRSSHFYRHEMRSSSNAQMPTLLASIATETSNPFNPNNSLDRTFTFRFHSNGTFQSETPGDCRNPSSSNVDNEQIQLFYDPTLEGFFDPETGLYYELTST